MTDGSVADIVAFCSRPATWKWIASQGLQLQRQLTEEIFSAPNDWRRMELRDLCAGSRSPVSRGSVLPIVMTACYRQKTNTAWRDCMYKCSDTETGTSHKYTAHYSPQHLRFQICRFDIFSLSEFHIVAPSLPVMSEFLVFFGMYIPRVRFRPIWLKKKLFMIHLMIHCSRGRVVSS